MSAVVLVIDDDHAILRLVTATLRDDGFEVVGALNGAEALDRLDEATPEAIVLDIQMPVMDGDAFYRELRRRGYDTPVLVISAAEAMRSQRELGAEDYLDKPFEPTELSDRVQTLVDARSTARAVEVVASAEKS